MNGDDLHEPASHTWPDACDVPEETYCSQCGSDQRSVGPGGVCWKCREDNAAGVHDQYDGPTEDIEDVMCVACGGTGEAPDNGTNMGECDECCGSGLMA